MEKELSFLSRNEAVRRMNEWGKERRPFVFVIDYKQERSLVEEPEGIDPSVCLYDFCGVTNAGGSAFAPYTQDIRWQAFPESESRFAGAFEVVRRNLLAGNSFLVNLTRKVPIDTNLSLEEMFHRSRAPYRLWLRGRFVCFSPEIFVRIRGGNIFAYPMKGTIDAALPDAQQALREDEKEAAEHATVVDLLRNDLSMYATGVTVFRYRYFDRLVPTAEYCGRPVRKLAAGCPVTIGSIWAICFTTCCLPVLSRELLSRRRWRLLPRPKAMSADSIPV